MNPQLEGIEAITGSIWLRMAWLTPLVAAALLPWGAGLLLVGPVLGHASWHAYRGAVRWQEASAPIDAAA